MCVINVPSLQLSPKILWPAIPNFLAGSRLLALSVLEVEERDGKGLVAGEIVLLACCCLLVRVVGQLPGCPMQVSLVIGWMRVQPRHAPAFSLGRGGGAAMRVETLLSHCHFPIILLSFEWCQLIS